MKTILTTLTPKSDDISRIVRIGKKIGNTSYSVIGNRGRQYIAEATESYLPGQAVVIKRGLIIGRTKSSKTYKEVEV